MAKLHPLTANDIQDVLFEPRRFREGYAVEEVDEFLDDIEANIAQWQRFYGSVKLLALEVLEQPGKLTKADIQRKLEQSLKMAPVPRDG